MKNLLLILVLIVSNFALADTTDIRELLFTGENYAEVNLSTEKTKTEYRTVTVPSTCYRTVYRQRCGTSQPQCRPVCRNGSCRTVCPPPRPVCRTVPVQEPYRCMRQETRAVQVHDYFVETKVRFEFNNADVRDNAYESFKVQMNGEISSLSVNGSKNYIIVLDKQSRTEDRRAGVKHVDLTYKLNFVPSEQLVNVLGNGIKNVKYRRGVVTFRLGAGFNLHDFTQDLQVYQNRRLGRDRLLLNTKLSENDANVQTIANDSVVSVDLNSMGINAPVKARIILKTKYNFDINKVLNRNEFKFEDSKNIVFR